MPDFSATDCARAEVANAANSAAAKTDFFTFNAPSCNAPLLLRDHRQVFPGTHINEEGTQSFLGEEVNPDFRKHGGRNKVDLFGIAQPIHRHKRVVALVRGTAQAIL